MSTSGGGDPDFWRAFRDGDPRALDELYRAHAPGVARGLGAHPLSRREGREELRDLVQETFCRAFAVSARRRYDAARPYRPYLLRIGLNLLTDRLRSRRREVEVHRELAALPSSAASRVEPIRDALLLAIVSEYVAQLDPACRRVFQARYIDGQSQRLAARTLGISHQSLRTLEGQIKGGLRSRLMTSAHPG
jgi:RNA polymerase sigma factor (sigma-70 family)